LPPHRRSTYRWVRQENKWQLGRAGRFPASYWRCLHCRIRQRQVSRSRLTRGAHQQGVGEARPVTRNRLGSALIKFLAAVSPSILDSASLLGSAAPDTAHRTLTERVGTELVVLSPSANAYFARKPSRRFARRRRGSSWQERGLRTRGLPLSYANRPMPRGPSHRH
jgi:hypothetical protein